MSGASINIMPWAEETGGNRCSGMTGIEPAILGLLGQRFGLALCHYNTEKNRLISFVLSGPLLKN